MGVVEQEEHETLPIGVYYYYIIKRQQHAKAILKDSITKIFEKVKKKYAICIIWVSLTDFPEPPSISASVFYHFEPNNDFSIRCIYRSNIYVNFACLGFKKQENSSRTNEKVKIKTNNILFCVVLFVSWILPFIVHSTKLLNSDWSREVHDMILF
jgi:hypothetical protein